MRATSVLVACDATPNMTWNQLGAYHTIEVTKVTRPRSQTVVICTFSAKYMLGIIISICSRVRERWRLRGSVDKTSLVCQYDNIFSACICWWTSAHAICDEVCIQAEYEHVRATSVSAYDPQPNIPWVSVRVDHKIVVPMAIRRRTQGVVSCVYYACTTVNVGYWRINSCRFGRFGDSKVHFMTLRSLFEFENMFDRRTACMHLLVNRAFARCAIGIHTRTGSYRRMDTGNEVACMRSKTNTTLFNHTSGS